MHQHLHHILEDNYFDRGSVGYGDDEVGDKLYAGAIFPLKAEKLVGQFKLPLET